MKLFLATILILPLIFFGAVFAYFVFNDKPLPQTETTISLPTESFLK